MKTPWCSLMLAAVLLAPPVYVRADNDEGKGSKKEEMSESPQKQHAEEQEAQERYQKAVAKHGADSPQAKKAKRRWKHEMKEHGHKEGEKNESGESGK